MMTTSDPTLARIIAWGEGREDIRALVLSSSRTNPTVSGELVDALSDYDLDVVIRGETRAWYEDRRWLEDLGPVMVGWVEPPGIEYGMEAFGCVIIYQDYVKIDFTILSVDIFAHIVAEPTLRGGWDDGHVVLLDKDHMAEHMPAPTHREFIPQPPSEDEYRDLIQRFFTESTYVAKNLYRDELITFKSIFEGEMKAEYLSRMLAWRMEIDAGWSVRLGLTGRRLKKRLPAALWSELEQTYVGSGTEENWTALYRTIDFFHRVAVEVGNALGFAYPDALEKRVVEYLRYIQNHS